MHPRETLTAFDAFLAARHVRLEAVVIGGAALSLLGVVSRPTKDCDILHPRLTDEVLRAAREFAAESRAGGEPLRDDWLNNGPASLVAQLPSGWEDRLQDVFAGNSISRSLVRSCLPGTQPGPDPVKSARARWRKGDHVVRTAVTSESQ